MRVQAAKKELYLSRRLAVESIVNTITANNPDVKVQLLFELEGTAWHGVWRKARTCCDMAYLPYITTRWARQTTSARL